MIRKAKYHIGQTYGVRAAFANIVVISKIIPHGELLHFSGSIVAMFHFCFLSEMRTPLIDGKKILPLVFECVPLSKQEVKNCSR